MRNKIKKRIVDAFEKETPNLYDKIAEKSKGVEREFSPISERSKTKGLVFKKISALLCSLIVFAIGVSTGLMIPLPEKEAKAQASLYIDVNPSIELIIGEENEVLSCNAVNEDAQKVIGDMEFKGIGLKTAMNAIVGSMYVNGYLSVEENSMLLSVDGLEAETIQDFLTEITEQVNKVFEENEMNCSIIAQSISVTEELKTRAQGEGVSVGKMYFVQKMISSIEELAESDTEMLAELSIKDLNLIYSTRPGRDEQGNGKKQDEYVSGKVEGRFGEEEALSLVLEELGVSLQEVERVSVKILPFNRGEVEIVCVVSLTLKEENKEYRYEVDCQTGEVCEEQGGLVEPGGGHSGHGGR